MFYTKTRLSEDAVLRTKLSPKNVFCTCPICGAEVPIDLRDYAADRDFDLTDSAVLCAECTTNLLNEENA